jgi:4-alpha-glucanotransferase
VNFPRQSGILLHPTSLPGPYGIGEIGPHARAFADTLKEMGQQLWQVLPVGPTGYADSPYQSLSTYAGNSLLVSFDLLVRDGLLSRSALARFPKFPDAYCDFSPVIEARDQVLHSVCRTFLSKASKTKRHAFERFCAKNADWLDDFALYFAIKNAHGGKPWTQWEPALARREAAALRRARQRYHLEIRDAKVRQFLFFDQWERLVAYCHRRNIRIIGDIPIFVAHDSSDVWAHPELFHLDDRGFPTIVAGVPPDYFSVTGQLWGNPLYRWDVHRETGYAWWIERMRKIFERVDIVRIDHFRGFEKYWEIPGSETTAIKGRWVEGPGRSLFDALIRALGRLPIIAEDLGVITPEVEALRDAFQFPGMRILQFAFGNDAKAADYRPESYPPNCVVYTGTHDNDTCVGWFNSEAGKNSTRSRSEIEAERRTVLAYLKSDGRRIHRDMIELAMKSRANTAVVPLQDVMGLGSAARMNIPGTTSGNWNWRFTWNLLTPEMKDHLAGLATATDRIR